MTCALDAVMRHVGERKSSSAMMAARGCVLLLTCLTYPHAALKHMAALPTDRTTLHLPSDTNGGSKPRVQLMMHASHCLATWHSQSYAVHAFAA